MPTPAARNTGQQVVHYLRRSITFADNGSQLVIGVVPAGSVLMKPTSGLAISTVFNAGTNNFIDMGTSADDDLYGTDLSGLALGFIPFDEAVSPLVLVDTIMTVTVGLTGTAATTGAAEAIICFIPDNDL